MRLLHTSDWHLGKRLFDKERYDVFEKFLAWLLSTIRQERVDTLIVAGDIFDTAVPTNKSLRLYYDFLSQLTSSECRHVVIVSGNHDSPTLLEAPKEILENFGVHVIGGAESPEDEVIELKDKAGNLEGVVCAVPFLRERDILRLKDDSTLSRAEEIQLAVENHYKSVVKAAIDRMGAKRVPLIATGHLFTVGSPKGEDVNELYIGATGAVPVNIFPSEIDYLALGHIHRAEYKINTRCNFLYIGYILYHKFLNRPRHRACHLPSLSHCLLVGLAGASFARRNSHNLKPRMVFKQCNKTLPHHSGRT